MVSGLPKKLVSNNHIKAIFQKPPLPGGFFIFPGFFLESALRLPHGLLLLENGLVFLNIKIKFIFKNPGYLPNILIIKPQLHSLFYGPVFQLARLLFPVYVLPLCESFHHYGQKSTPIVNLKKP